MTDDPPHGSSKTETPMAYHPEPYWSRVAESIRRRGPKKYLAGDDNPYYRYKRRKFLRRFLPSLDVSSKMVLEVGCGPGGNLLEIAASRPAKLIGVDISQAMVDLARENLSGQEGIVELHKIDGTSLPLPDRAVDVTFTVTVLQHNTDPLMFQALVRDICRVTRTIVLLIEDTGTDSGPVASDRSGLARPVSAYESECRKHGFRLNACDRLGLRASRRLHELVWSAFVPRAHKEGQPFPVLAKLAMRVGLPVTRMLDEIYPDDRDLTKMVFVRDAGSGNH